MEFPRARLYQSNLRSYFHTVPVTVADARGSTSGNSVDTLPVGSSAFARGVGNTDAQPIDVDLWLTNRGFGGAEGVTIAAAIDVDAWVLRNTSDAEAQDTVHSVHAADAEEDGLATQGQAAETVDSRGPLVEAESRSARPLSSEKDLFACGICSDTFNRPVVTLCMHIFCDACITQNFGYSMACPLCRSMITDPPMRDVLFEAELTQAVADGVIAEAEGVSRQSPYTWPTSLFRQQRR
ncbi:hypothetical protein C8F04DRAFT_1260997 [Mycena alexandri]|uniref:RING-type domain-containing protein n=1 Tax=Mycena alexandri TaxID=1745969 RepID=A0AAD6X3G9_9AGAR|nr:hypothetical protein C8F04DRAFT_1260997 [Mycena alexandri]